MEEALSIVVSLIANSIGLLRAWLVLVLVSLVSSIWLVLDSRHRRLPVLGWRLASFSAVSMTFPAILYPMLGSENQSRMVIMGEPLSYMALVGAVVPPFLLLLYWMIYRGRVACSQGHVYSRARGDCPGCASTFVPQASKVEGGEICLDPRMVSSSRKARTKANAWLVSTDGDVYQVYREMTTIGKSARSDVQVVTDNTVSRMHAKIVERSEGFYLYDLGSTNGTRLNGIRLNGPAILETDDVIEIGDYTRLTFIHQPPRDILRSPPRR